MNFRVTSFASGRQALKYASHYNYQILQHQKQISSGLRLHRPSDDPVSFRQSESYTARLQELRTQSVTIVDAETKLNTSVSQLQAAHDLIVRAKTLAQQGVQTTSQSEQTALAVEVEGLLVSLQEITKSKSAGSYLFGGARADQLPFTFDQPATPGGTLQVDYLGSSQNSTALIGGAIAVDTFFAGDQIFGNAERGDTVVLGKTGAAKGAGTDNLIGRATLQIRHELTTYSGVSGLAAGASSAEHDSLIGTMGQYKLHVDDTSGTGSYGTITLNGGKPIPWTNSDVDLQVKGKNGGILYVDTSNITPGYAGDVPFSSAGTLSVDNGLTRHTIDFSASQTVVDSTSGRQVHIDSRDITRVGDNHLEFAHTSNVFQVFYELKEDLLNTRELSDLERSHALERRIGELIRLGDHVLEVMGQQSASLQTLDQIEFRVQDLQLEVETQLTNLKSADVTDVILQLQNDQALLEYTYAVTSQIASTSLIDFLR